MINERIIHNKNYYIKEIDVKEARELVKKYHYSGRSVGNSKLHLGVYENGSDNLFGVLQYGYPMNPAKTPQKIVKGSNQHEMYELNRMAMTDDAPKLSESQAIGLSIKWIKKYKPEIKWLLSYSDGKEGNFGTIYQATNWKYIGYMVSNSFYRLDDMIKHGVSTWGMFKKKQAPGDTRTELEILKDTFNNVSAIHCKQFTYVYPLQPGVEFLKPFVDVYPKEGVDNGLIKEVYYKRDGEVFPNPVTVEY